MPSCGGAVHIPAYYLLLVGVVGILSRCRYRGNGAGAMATLTTVALNLLRLGGFTRIVPVLRQ